MGGLSRVVRRLSMTSLAFGLAFGTPNMGLAQTPRFEPSRLPWQTAGSLDRPKTFDQSWMRVVVDTQLLLRRFSAPYPFPHGIDTGAAARAAIDRAIWTANVRNLIQQPANRRSLDVTPVRVTMTPVPFTSGVVAESRGMEGTLVGVKFEVID